MPRVPPVDDGNDDANVTSRGFPKMKRRLWALGREIQNIRDKGFSAISNLAARNVFRGMFNSLAKTYDKFFEQWEEAVDFSEDHGVGFPTEEDMIYLEQTKTNYYDAQGYALQMFPGPTSSTQTTSRASTSMLNTSTNTSRAILPKIHIKSFKGDISSWPVFKQMYESLILGDNNLSNVERFHYLLSFLDGPALDVIKYIPVLDSNLNQAWDALCQVYDNKRKLACNCIDKLLSFKASTSRPTAESLQLYLANVTEMVTSLQNLNIPNLDEYLLCELALRGLDPHTREAFELSVVAVTYPRFPVLQNFIKNRCQALRMTTDLSVTSNQSSRTHAPHSSNVSTKFAPNKFQPRQSSQVLLSTDRSASNDNRLVERNPTAPFSCFICKKPHTIAECRSFKQSTPSQRLDLLKNFPGCRNCLHLHHKTADCKSKFNCKECNARHHSDLHLPIPTSNNQSSIPKGSQQQATSSGSTTSPSFVGASTTIDRRGVLLGTIRARILDSNGHARDFRGVLDPGSQFSFITQDCLRKLGKSTRPFSGSISGVNSSNLKNIVGRVNIAFVPNISTEFLETEAIVVPTITPPLPQESLHSIMWHDYRSYNLSDPDFTTSLPISFLIGADLFTDVIKGSPIVLHEKGPRLLNTLFGFTVIGKFVCEADPSGVSLLSISDTAHLIERFWEVEEPSVKITPVSPEEKECEDHFLRTHYREPNGRYVLFLPIKNQSSSIVPNISKAISRFYALETKFRKDVSLQRDYCQFMQEYLDLGHMKVATSDPSYVIPHHPVYKIDTNGSKKLRVVFDASFRTASGSLNDHLHTGRKLQADISNVVLNFRRFKWVMSCDVVKMFRQILIDPSHRKYQQIVWRFSPSDPLTFFELTTVTYGLTSSPFQAQRVLHQLSMDEGAAYPAAATVLLENTYIDDCAFGADTIEEITALKNELSQLLAKGGFELSKWKTNHPPLLNTETVSNSIVSLCHDEDKLTKILGLSWDPKSDAFCYEVTTPQAGFTKRTILSVIARLFDPLGYLAPVVFFAKTILQETWKIGVGWDEPIPDPIKTRWAHFIDDFPSLTKISVPRELIKSSSGTYELVTFCDPSERGYCAVAYLKAGDSDSHLSLLKSKTRLAPLKILTIPRLELCAALLLANLIKSLEPVLEKLNIARTFCFSDSQVVLAWLKTPPHRLMTFVANRVQQIVNITRPEWWHHIKGVDNPADVGSRGILSTALLNNRLWWEGPTWCTLPITQWPLSQHSPASDDVPELKPVQPIALTACLKKPLFMNLIDRSSSYIKVVRIVAYILRFVNNARIPKRKRRKRRVGTINTAEFTAARNFCIRTVQLEEFSEVFSKDCTNLSPELRKLSLFIDHNELVRVGGRLAHAPLPIEHKHPILLPPKSHLTYLIVDYLHKKNSHAGPSALLAFVRQQYWIPRARNLIRSHKSKCITCIRFANVTSNPFMGNLPRSRFDSTRPFINCGVDFAGPFLCRLSSKRKSGVEKCYLCLFICMASRAVHLELATSLSVEAFLDAFDRFTSRRGLPAHMFSDCGTNFIGSANYIQKVYEWFHREDTQSQIADHTSHLSIQWHFNPPASPHMGGSWESHIKIAKLLLYKEFGNHPYTQSELNTVFVKVEGIINSRPLLQSSDSPEDQETLTPGHFLIGQPINALPEPDFTDVPINRLNRWQLLRTRIQHFWTRWKEEYLSSLQERQKWTKRPPNMQVGDIVLLKSTNTSPTYWPLARIVEVHPGSDGIVRVVSLKTSRGTYKRSITNIVRLPISHPD